MPFNPSNAMVGGNLDGMIVYNIESKIVIGLVSKNV